MFMGCAAVFVLALAPVKPCPSLLLFCYVMEFTPMSQRGSNLRLTSSPPRRKSTLESLDEAAMRQMCAEEMVGGERAREKRAACDRAEAGRREQRAHVSSLS